MKRPMLIVALGMITGIIGGAYFTKNMLLLFFLGIEIITIFLKRKQWRYLKIGIKLPMILLFLFSSCISCIITKQKENQYSQIEEGMSQKLSGVIQSEAEEKEYGYSYKIKIKSLQTLNNITCQLYVKKGKQTPIFHYGDRIVLQGEIQLPEEARNTGGFNQKRYFQSKGWYATILAKEIQKTGEEKWSIGKWGNEIRKEIKKRVRENLSEQNANLLLAILIGEKDSLSGEIIERFQESSLIHILCVSGAHISFLLVAIQKLCSKLGRNKSYICSLGTIGLLFVITGFSASVARACLMGGTILLSKLCFRSNDTITSISISLIILLLGNPFLLFDTGLLLSYAGTIGILAFAKIAESKITKSCGKLKRYILKTVMISCCAQIILMPITAYLFQTIHPTFFISNLLATPLFGAILYVGYGNLLLSYLFPPFCIVTSKVLNLLLIAFEKVAELSCTLPFSQTKVIRPSIVCIILYYVIVLSGRYAYLLYHKKNRLYCYEKRLKYWLGKITLNRVISVSLIVILCFQGIYFLPRKISNLFY